MMSLTVRFCPEAANAKQKTTVNRKTLNVLENIFLSADFCLQTKKNDFIVLQQHP
jgi:hypothetical protein